MHVDPKALADTLELTAGTNADDIALGALARTYLPVLLAALRSAHDAAAEWRPIAEVGADTRKIIGWCVFGIKRSQGEARACTRYIYEGHVRPWEAHGCQQTVTHFKPWPEDAPLPVLKREDTGQ